MCPPAFFVSVASKGFRWAVNPLSATLAGRAISVAAKRLKAVVGSDPGRVPTGSGSLIRADQRTVASGGKSVGMFEGLQV
jgi:hypothetical protein